MLKVDTDKWGQTPELLRKIALEENHQTVMDWVHRYNCSGLEALRFRHTGGHPPFISRDRRVIEL